MENKYIKLAYLPSLASSSISEGDLLARLHTLAITPMCMVMQQSKSIMNSKSSTPPTAMPTIEAEDNTGLSAICITSMPLMMQVCVCV